MPPPKEAEIIETTITEPPKFVARSFDIDWFKGLLTAVSNQGQTQVIEFAPSAAVHLRRNCR